MIKILNTKSKKFNNQLNYYLNLRKLNFNSKKFIVKKILQDIEKNGDKSVIKYEKKFNKINKLNKKDLFILLIIEF